MGYTGDTDTDVLLGMADRAPDGIVIIDSEGLIRYWNQGAERIFGYTAAEAAGRNLDMIIPEKHRQRHWDGFVAAMASGTSKYGADDLLAVPALTADGTTVSIEFSVVLLTDADGKAAHVGAVIRDVTARRAQEKEVRRRLLATAPDDRAAPVTGG
ncbi:PAS domain-containing protein [Streptomyces beijiangensis]|uniref:PAS domain S-box protein n=1 Tax=Streptomyces beijiangensis TaxID=163361 RepID=A0A939F6V6_9ACTN|nr:PAS domain S-box protein [Streptomyces beijiangensis]MBO0512693.1 PAS domain S-box protein [Streptomyces beijiangensis]